MRISFSTATPSDGIAGTNGYGYATVCMIDSLRSLGYQVEDNDPLADVEIAFNQPQNWSFQKDKYKIGYHPWESTQLQPGWPEIMNQCDEIWTPSPLIADWYKNYSGIKVPVYVYEHGLEHEWKPVIRQPEEYIKFLHVGAEAARKGGWDVVRLFRRAFTGRKNVKLTLKMIHHNWKGVPSLGKVTYINERWGIKRMLDLFYSHDVYVYPSWGEGFGLTPLQAIGTGMPTITVPAWAPYNQFLDPDLNISAKATKSPWPDIHPGYMLMPDQDEVIDRMRYAADNYDKVRDFATGQARAVHEYYDWNRLTAETFGALENRLK